MNKLAIIPKAELRKLRKEYTEQGTVKGYILVRPIVLERLITSAEILGTLRAS